MLYKYYFNKKNGFKGWILGFMIIGELYYATGTNLLDTPVVWWLILDNKSLSDVWFENYFKEEEGPAGRRCIEKYIDSYKGKKHVWSSRCSILCISQYYSLTCTYGINNYLK